MFVLHVVNLFLYYWEIDGHQSLVMAVIVVGGGNDACMFFQRTVRQT